MKRVVVIPNIFKDPGLDITAKLIEKLKSLGLCVLIDEKFTDKRMNLIESYSVFPTDVDLIIVVGGDGSIINASTLAVQNDIPLLGINLGRVGYLAVVDPDELDELEGLKTDSYVINRYMLLEVEKIGNDGLAQTFDKLALNDVVACHDACFGISDFQVGNGDEEYLDFRADGIIISTPAGSTAYSLSAGGPVISHNLECILVTPVCPHVFINRSVIYSADESIFVKNTGRANLSIVVDGSVVCKLETDECCRVYKSQKHLKMISFGRNPGISTLLSKI